MRKIILQADKNGRILKVLSAMLPQSSFGELSSALRKKDVIVNGVRVKENVAVSFGDELIIFLPDAKEVEIPVVYEDDNIVVVNKGKHIEVCDGEYNLVGLFESKGKTVLPVHRLDRNTEGLVIFAKTEQAFRAMVDGLRAGCAKKKYVAEVYGTPTQKSATFTDYILKNAEKSEVRVFSTPTAGAEKAITSYEVIKSSGGVSLLSVTISEGKTHQIRASLAYHGLPIIGDGKYGKNQINKTYKAKTQKLKCYEVEFCFDKQSPLAYLNEVDIAIKAEV